MRHGTPYAVHADQLGTPRVITDPSYNVVWRWDSDPFGVAQPDERPAGRRWRFVYNLRFPGQYHDVETGLNYNYFRDYDPKTGRYVESDPSGLYGGLNTHTYVEGNPLFFADPTGLEGEEDPTEEVIEPTVEESLAARDVPDLIKQIQQYDPSYKYSIDTSPGYRYSSTDVEYLENKLRGYENSGECPVSSSEHDINRRALNDLLKDITHNGRTPLSPNDADAAIQLGKELNIPGVRDDRNTDHWKGGPHIHIPQSGVGDGSHIPALPH